MKMKKQEIDMTTKKKMNVRPAFMSSLTLKKSFHIT